MTIDQKKLSSEGCDYWFEYVRVNGYSKKPNNQGLKKLSKLLDLNLKYLQKAIHLHLFGEYE